MGKILSIVKRKSSPKPQQSHLMWCENWMTSYISVLPLKYQRRNYRHHHTKQSQKDFRPFPDTIMRFSNIKHVHLLFHLYSFRIHYTLFAYEFPVSHFLKFFRPSDVVPTYVPKAPFTTRSPNRKNLIE